MVQPIKLNKEIADVAPKSLTDFGKALDMMDFVPFRKQHFIQPDNYGILMVGLFKDLLEVYLKILDCIELKAGAWVVRLNFKWDDHLICFIHKMFLSNKKSPLGMIPKKAFKLKVVIWFYSGLPQKIHLRIPVQGILPDHA